jgi:hypothetical protein
MSLKICMKVVGVLLWLSATGVQAADGVLEINQACAVNGGCFTGDTTGFPVTITQPGSYLLTGNLTLSAANDTGILVDSDDVTLDLNGFTIQGITVCSGAPVTSCTNVADPIQDAGYGVTTPLSTPRRNVAVMNGTVRNMGSTGISLKGRVIDVRAISNGSSGISVLADSIVRGCTATNNRRQGINVNNYFTDPDNALTLIGDNVASHNGEHGVNVSNIAALVIGNVISNNGSRGLNTSTGHLGYSKNVFLNNGLEPVGNSLGDNLCDGVIC